MSLTSSVSISYRSTLYDTIELSTVTAVVNQTSTLSFTDGTGAGECDLAWSDQNTLSGSASATLDLTNLTGTVGETITFAKVKGLVIENTGTEAITVGNAASNAFDGFLGGPTETVIIPASGKFVIASDTGFTVDGTHKDLKLAGTSPTYNIWIIGTSA